MNCICLKAARCTGVARGNGGSRVALFRMVKEHFSTGRFDMLVVTCSQVSELRVGAEEGEGLIFYQEDYCPPFIKTESLQYATAWSDFVHVELYLA